MSTAGDTAIIVPFPELDELVARWIDPSTEPGLPAHVTLLAPFAHVDDITDAHRERIRHIAAGEPLGPIGFRRCGRFPNVAYLDPEPAAPFLRLTNALVAAFPDYPPYGGVFDEVIPHLTLAYGATSKDLDRVEADIATLLPIHAAPGPVSLIHFDGERWQHDQS